MANMKKPTKRQQQAMRSRERLVSAAYGLFEEYGYFDTTVQDICQAAGLSVGVFYHYFVSKQSILQAVKEKKNKDLLDYIDTKSISKDHIEALLEIFGFLCRQETDGSFDLVCGSFSLDPQKLVKPDPWLLDLIGSIVKSAQAVGELTDLYPPRRIAQDLLICAKGFVFHWCESCGTFDVYEAQQSYLRRILRAYLGPNGRLDLSGVHSQL